MPKKAKKPFEQKTAEEYFPVDETDLKYAIEKPQKEKMIFPEPKKKKTNRKKTLKIKKLRKELSNRKVRSRKTKTPKDYSPPKIELKKDGYELIITEKPQAALKIASALGSSKKNNLHGVPYYEVERQKTKIIVACAVGHLFTLTQIEKN
jgi:reverse gyrase